MDIQQVLYCHPCLWSSYLVVRLPWLWMMSDSTDCCKFDRPWERWCLPTCRFIEVKTSQNTGRLRFLLHLAVQANHSHGCAQRPTPTTIMRVGGSCQPVPHIWKRYFLTSLCSTTDSTYCCTDLWTLPTRPILWAILIFAMTMLNDTAHLPLHRFVNLTNSPHTCERRHYPTTLHMIV